MKAAVVVALGALLAGPPAARPPATRPATPPPLAKPPVGPDATAAPSLPLRPADVDAVVAEISAANVEATVRTLAGFHTRHTLSEQDDPKRGIGAAMRWIQGTLEGYAATSGGRLEVALDAFLAPAGKRVPRPTRVVNVVATLRGAMPEARDRLYVVSGHYDSRASDPMDARSDAPGANDDASGTAVVLELARVMSRRSFDATVVFLAVAGEEQGLLGSRHFAEEAARAGKHIEAMLTNDIVGNTHGDDGRVERGRVRVFAEGVPPRELTPALRTLLETGGENDSPPRQLARFIKEVGERHVPGFQVTPVWRKDRYLRGGDHSPFLEAGFPAVRVTEPAEDFRRQHQDVRSDKGIAYGDVPDAVDFAYAAQVARVDAAALATLAWAPARPRGVVVETAKLENETSLRWEPGREPDLAGYRIVWRETTAPFWQHAQEVGQVARATLALSKDDLVFGVVAVDKDGHASDAVYPLPAR